MSLFEVPQFWICTQFESLTVSEIVDPPAIFSVGISSISNERCVVAPFLPGFSFGFTEFKKYRATWPPGGVMLSSYWL